MNHAWSADRPGELADEEVQVWSFPLDPPTSRMDELERLLSLDERRRADRFLREEVRRRFVVGRARLRQLLGGVLATDPRALTFEYSSLGKPFLANGQTTAGIEFNLSNSHELALVAIGRDGELGVDVEYRRTVRDYQGLAKRYFATSEVRQMEGLPEPLRVQAFYHAWTRKEAILKAEGSGLTTPLHEVIVSVQPDQPAELREFARRSREQGPLPYCLYDLQPDPLYTAALATRRPPGQLSLHRWPADC